MATNQVQEGRILTLVAPSGGVVSGSGYVIGSLFVVALVTAAEGESFAGATEGVFAMTKVAAGSGKAFTAGEHVWYNNTSKAWDKTGSGLYQIGVAVDAAATTATTCNVMINRRVLAAT